MLKIDIFNTKSIDKAIDVLERYCKALERSGPQVVKELLEIGEPAAQDAFNDAQYAGNPNVTVTSLADGNTGKLTAEGPAVSFIEFGTGVEMGQGRTLPRPDGWALGTYGLGLGANPPWVFWNPVMGPKESWPEGTAHAYREHSDGTKELIPDTYWTEGNPPAGAMLKAYEDMYDAHEKVARAVVRREIRNG